MSLVVKGIEILIRKLIEKSRKVENEIVIKIGYSQYYAIYVHENLLAYHKVGQAKYLEIPMRNARRDLEKRINERMSTGLSFRSSLLLEAFKIQRESQLLVPIDTGALKASAFVREEK